MQVPMPSLQHEVMIEAVENHNPEVIVIDEIGRELEALAARTIAERGVQLIATAHGNALENLLLNPTLSDLVGGIESVTLSDEEARRRGTQKTVLERRAPPTFDILVEIQDRDRLLVHKDVAEAVDALLRGAPLHAELRYRDEAGNIQTEKVTLKQENDRSQRGPKRMGSADFSRQADEMAAASSPPSSQHLQPIRIYPHGIARNRLRKAAQYLHVPAQMVDNLREAQVLVTLRSYYRKRPRIIVDAENRGLPIHVLRSNTVKQMEHFLENLFHLEARADSMSIDQILAETQAAIEAVLAGADWIDLTPAPADVRRLQHRLAEEARLTSRSYGREPFRRVRIYREEA